jgi:tagatose 1,6-diphosphate aldolase
MIDPELAAIPAVQLGELNPRAGLIVTSEADGYQAIHEGTPATLLEGWRLEYSRMLAADAVKVLVQYPREPGELREREVAFVDAVAGQCRSLQLAFVLEVLVPERVGSDPDIHCSIVVQAARELSGRCDVYKTQFPYPGGAGAGDAQSLNSCLALNAACSAPWVILSGGVDPPEFERQVRLACAAGASGFLAGRSIWEDGARASEAGERRRLLEAIAVPRLRRLTAVAEAWGTPWRARLTEELASMPTTGPHWFERQDAFEQERRP